MVDPKDKDTVDNVLKDKPDRVPQTTNSRNKIDSDECSEEEEEDVNPGCDETLMMAEDDDLFNQIVKIAPGEGRQPLSLLKDLHAEVLSFPSIYGGAERRFKEVIKVTYTDIAKSEARNHDRRACTPTKLLYSCKLLQTHRVAGALAISLRKKKGGQSSTAGMLKNPDGVSQLVAQDDAYK